MSTSAAAPPVTIPADSRRWLVVFLLFAAILVNYLDRGNLSIAAVPLMREFSVSPPAMGALLSAFFWTYALLQIPAGYLVDRFGLKWSYAGAFLLWSIASAAVGIATSFHQILALRLLLGVGEALAVPASIAYIRENFREDQQGLPTAVYLAGMMLGPGLGALAGSFLLERLGWRLLFILTGFGGCIWILPWLMFAPGGRSKSSKITSKPAAPVDWKRLFRGPLPWGITIGAFFYSYFWYFCLTWLPSYLVMARGFSFLKMGAFTAVPLLGMAVVSAISGRLADRIIARTKRPLLVRKVFVCTGFLLGTSMLLLTGIESSAAVLGVLTFSLLGIGVASANYWALTQVVSPVSIIGRVIGYQNMVANFAGVCAPILTGVMVGETKNFGASILFAGGSLFVAAAAVFFLIRERDVNSLQSQFPG